MEQKKPNYILIFAAVFFILSLITTVIVTIFVISDGSTKMCSYNGESYKNGQTFMDDCNSCSCDNGEVACTTMACEEGADGIEEEDYVDLEDPESDELTCEYEDVYYEEGEEFTANDGCNTCTCSQGEVSCTDMACEE